MESIDKQIYREIKCVKKFIGNLKEFAICLEHFEEAIYLFLFALATYF